MKTLSEEEAKGRTTVAPTKELLPIKGRGYVDLLCGNCMAKLTEGTNEGEYENVIIHCPLCQAYNEVKYPELEILNLLYEDEMTQAFRTSTTPRNISLRLDLPMEDVQAKLRELASRGTVSSSRGYYYITEAGRRRLESMFPRRK